ncbi:MAG TPA: glycosyltransferase family 4 protein [Rhizomicrobium sp.]|jgi:glycosyltransferase involved in cell wall biosynthesis
MTADTIGGLWTFALVLCEALCKSGTEVALVTMGRLPDAAKRAQAARIRNLSLISTDYRLEWTDDCARDVAASQEFVLRLAEALRPDIVHANTYCHAALPFGVPVLLTAHSCVATWWRACKNTPMPAQYLAYSTWIADAISRADLLVAPTSAFLHEFRSVHGRARAQRVIRNGRAIPPCRTATKEPVVLAAGRLWDEGKNIDVLCRAAQAGNLAIEIAGDNTSPDGRVAEFENVTLLGRLGPDALLQRMARAAVFAAPARYEPFGLSILEAALSGCALVLGDIRTLRELWDGAAIFVPPDDAMAWRHALSGLIAEPARAAHAGMRAQAHAERYSSEAMATGYLAAYAALLPHKQELPLAGVAA